MSGAIRFTISHTCKRTRVRVGRVETPHGAFDTPAFMTVGTRGTVKGLYPSLLAQAG